MEWKEVKLGDLCKIQTGPFGSQLHQADYVPEGIPCIMPTNIGQKLDFIIDNIAHVTEGDADRLSRHLVKEGDIVYARRGDIEKCAYVTKNEKGWLCGTGCLKLTSFNEIVDSHFIAYQLSTQECKKWIVGNAVGTTMLNLNTGILGELPISLPSLKIQSRIASILSSLDSKIETNNKINAKLEEMAQALFKSWFVDFEPFKDKGMVESELGMIPEGWRVGKLGDIAEINPKLTLKKGQEATYLDMSAMPTSGSFPKEWTRKEYAGGMKFQNHDTLMARITPCLENGKVAYVDFLSEQEVGFGSTEYIVMRPKNGKLPEFFYFLCRHREFVDYATKNMNGSSGRQRVSGETIGNYSLVFPPESVIESLECVFKGIMDRIKNNGLENLRLSQLRDTLLPKLMNGNIELLI